MVLLMVVLGLLLLLSTLCELFGGRVLKEVSYVHCGRKEKKRFIDFLARVQVHQIEI
jgi:hypothetical protein